MGASRFNFLRFAVALGLVTLTVLFAARPAAAAECGNGYLYAFQFTAHGNTTSHTCSLASTPYYGWAGVDGQIITPTALPTHTAPAINWHVADWLTTGYYGLEAYIQVGEVAGCIGSCASCAPCINDQSHYHAYLESLDNSEYYLLIDRGTTALGSGTTFRIDYFDSCWEAFDHYNTLITFWCASGFPSSGLMQAGMELFDETGSDGTASNSPATFGTNAGGTNQTLRLKGGGGWVDWTSTIPQGTSTQDLRTFSPRSTWWSPFHTYWNFITYSNA